MKPLTKFSVKASANFVSSGIHRWHFTAANIKAVSASKRDDRSMFLYVHENSDDFNLVFPSAAHCNKFVYMLIAYGQLFIVYGMFYCFYDVKHIIH